MFDPSFVNASKLAAKAHVAGTEHVASKTLAAKAAVKTAAVNGHELAGKAQATAAKAVIVNAHHGVI